LTLEQWDLLCSHPGLLHSSVAVAARRVRAALDEFRGCWASGHPHAAAPRGLDLLLQLSEAEAAPLSCKVTYLNLQGHLE